MNSNLKKIFGTFSSQSNPNRLYPKFITDQYQVFSPTKIEEAFVLTAPVKGGGTAQVTFTPKKPIDLSELSHEDW